MFTLIVLVTTITHLPYVGDLPAIAGWSLNFTWESDCRRAEEAIKTEFTSKGTTVKTKCVQVR